MMECDENKQTQQTHPQVNQLKSKGTHHEKVDKLKHILKMPSINEDKQQLSLNEHKSQLINVPISNPLCL